MLANDRAGQNGTRAGADQSATCSAQQFGAADGSGASVDVPIGGGPGGLGGGAQGRLRQPHRPDHLDRRSPTPGTNGGGPVAIPPFATNLSLVVSQTQEVHEEIVDLLEQLRRCRTCR